MSIVRGLVHRRLNPQLFDDAGTQQVGEKPHFSAVASKKMEEEMNLLKKSVSRLESQVEVLRGQLAQVGDRTEKRNDRISKAMTHLEQQDRQSNLELLQKVRRLDEQMKERKIIDGKIGHMVDRYNMSLQQFENRLSSLQRVISEKEMTLMKYHSAIEQIFKEIDKMKNERFQGNAATPKRDL